MGSWASMSFKSKAWDAYVKVMEDEKAHSAKDAGRRPIL